jgi:subtilisin family serine protease
MKMLLTLIHVLIIDTGTTPLMQYLPYLGKWEAETHTGGHGTSVTSLVLFGDKLKDIPCANVVVDVCVGLQGKIPSACLSEAPSGHYAFINISGGGATKDILEGAHIKRLIEGGAIVVAAAGNENAKLNDKHKFYPASYYQEGIPVRAVANGKSLKQKDPTSNYGDKLYWIPGQKVRHLNIKGGISKSSGTSMSAALLTHKYIMERCKQ